MNNKHPSPLKVEKGVGNPRLVNQRLVNPRLGNPRLVEPVVAVVVGVNLLTS